MSPPENKIPPLKNLVTSLWSVGAERAAQLARLEIFTIEDLLLHRPKRYEDRRHFRKISELTKDEPFTARGKIVALGLKRFRGGSKSVFEIILDDGSARLHCRWWNLPFMENYFAMGDEVFVFGKLAEAKPRVMTHPETEVIEGGEESFIHINRIAPIYPLTEGLPQRWLRGLIWRTLEKFENLLVGQASRLSPSTDGKNQRQAGSLSYANAIRMIHFPEELTDIEIARRRLALDEFIALQLQIQSRRKKFEANVKALPCGGDNRLMKPFLSALGFKLTESQTKVLREIRHDMNGSSGTGVSPVWSKPEIHGRDARATTSASPMRRLLQGDVGSGKTAVAACSALMAIESGFNVALMAPTEILAEQHYRNFVKWFEPLGVKVLLQTGSRKTASDEWRVASDKQTAISSLVTRHLSLTIGTHALLTSGFDLPKLGLVIIDEQHKFGVAQREQLVRKGNYPHLLVMTATPIPRTLGLTLYGDLDVSTISEMPAGRGKIKTFVRTTDKLPKVFEFIREKISAGRQAFVVYPRVEDSSKELKAVTTEFENLRTIFAPSRAGLLHGRLKSAEKENVMADFRANKIQILLSTSLIEVGLDVPNATIMLIENSEMFGLAQLHQLRGRIGRGAHESFCILISDAKNLEARGRLKILEETNDGFKIAEADLKLRGPGELLGREQSGMPNFRFGNLIDDLDLIRQAREIISQISTTDGQG